MSFLNPVNEPVLRFSSTDDSAPQINYNSRVAGDVKAVLKACLVTGYGATESAGWSIVNEVDNVCEFVSPSVARSDYRLGIDDSSTASTTWYYQYQDVRVNPKGNSPSKSFSRIDASAPVNGWEFYVSPRGFIFVELFNHAFVPKKSARLTYMGAVKSAVAGSDTHNMFFTNIGHGSTVGIAHRFYEYGYLSHTTLATYNTAEICTAVQPTSVAQKITRGAAVADVVSEIYLSHTASHTILAKLPGMMYAFVNNADDVYGVASVQGLPATATRYCLGNSDTMSDYISKAGNVVVLSDYWEY